MIHFNLFGNRACFALPLLSMQSSLPVLQQGARLIYNLSYFKVV
jgi:hypothetical protein